MRWRNTLLGPMDEVPNALNAMPLAIAAPNSEQEGPKTENGKTLSFHLSESESESACSTVDPSEAAYCIVRPISMSLLG